MSLTAPFAEGFLAPQEPTLCVRLILNALVVIYNPRPQKQGICNYERSKEIKGH